MGCVVRNFQTLDRVTRDTETGIILIESRDQDIQSAYLSFRREGSYLAISASYGPLEVAMRLRYDDVARVLTRLKPITGLQTTRQVGSGQALLALGLQDNGSLVIRPTIVADATGNFAMNLILPGTVCNDLYEWLDIKT